jgi:hypothetical protein
MDDFEIDDILNNLNKKESKKKNTSKAKGNRGENQLADILEDRFPGKKFFRVTGSGNRWSQVDLPTEYKGVFAGDIVCPSDFKFCMECKYGYDDFELCGFFAKPHPKVDEWLTTVLRDSGGISKKPMLCWRKPRQPWLAFIAYVDGLGVVGANNFFRYGKDWMVLALDKLLTQPDEWWFK